MRRPLWMVLSFCVLLASSRFAMAHYLWVVIDTGGGEKEFAHIYFEESPSPGDGSYTDHFLGKADVWVRTLEQPAPDAVKAVEVKQGDKRWMKVPLASSKSRSVDAYGKFGVYEYGSTKVLLHYYARNVQCDSHDALHELSRAEQMQCDLVPHGHGRSVEVTLRWKDEPVSDRMVFIGGPDGFRQNVKTDERGQVSISAKKSGRYTFRSSVEEPTPGEDNGETYERVRHNVTLWMTLPLND